MNKGSRVGTRVRLAIGILLSLAFLYLAMRGIDWARLAQLLSAASYGYLFLVVILIVVISWVRAIRWRLLTRRDPGVDLTTLFHLVNIGYLFNNILPAKAGEAVRAYLAGRKLTGKYGQAVSSLLVERLLDVLAVVVVLVLLLPVIAVPEWVRNGGLVLGIVAIGGTVALLAIARVGPRAVEWVWRWVGRLPVVGRPGVKTAFEELVTGFGVLLEGRILMPVLLATGGVWFGYAMLNYLMLYVFRMNHLPFAAAALVLCTTGFSMMMPSSPGAMGVFEWAGVQGLLVFAIDQSAAFGYMLGLHLFTNLVLILLGIVGMISQGVTYAHVRGVVARGALPPDRVIAPSRASSIGQQVSAPVVRFFSRAFPGPGGRRHRLCIGTKGNMSLKDVVDRAMLSAGRESVLNGLLRNESDVAYRRRVRTMLAYLDPQAGQWILDCGTGMGFYARTIRRLYPDVRVLGIDMDTRALSFARAHLDERIPVLLGDIARLPLAAQSMDSVLMSEVLEHLPDEVAGLAEVHRVLKPGGKLAVTVPYCHYPAWYDPINRLSEAIRRRPIRTGPFAGIWANHERLYDSEQLTAVLSAAGFSVGPVAYLTHYCFPGTQTIVYTLGKGLIEKGLLPPAVSRSVHRFEGEANRGSPLNPLNWALSLFHRIDRLNEDLGRMARMRTFVNLAVLATRQ